MFGLSYLLRVWLFSSLVGTLLFVTVSYLMQTHTALVNFNDGVPMLLFIIFFALVLTIPAVLILLVFLYYIECIKISISSIKKLVSILAVLLTVATFLLLGFPFKSKDGLIIVCYCLPVIVIALASKLERS